MKKKVSTKPNRLVMLLLLMMSILVPIGTWAQTQPTNGDGSEDNPFQISNYEELKWFRDYVNGTSGDETTHTTACAILTADITMDANENWTPIGNTKVLYQGTFDGNGKTIKNLYISSTSENTGFFGNAQSGGCIKNITFDNAKVNSTAYYTGILVGDANYCTIQGVKTSATCSINGKGDYTGGIAGKARSNIINCENRATVNGSGDVGGVAGYYDSSSNSITSCANYGAVTGTGGEVGGMVGYFNSGTIQNCANYGNIQGENNVGNLIGFADKCNLNNVLGTGNVSETDNDKSRIGVLVGYISNTSCTAEDILVYNSSATVTVAGTVQTSDAVKAIGCGSLSGIDKIKSFTAEQLKTGIVAYLLQKNVSSDTQWGQRLNTDNYPVLGSTDRVYLSGDATMKCTGEIEGTYEILNTKPEQDGTLTMKHGSATHYAVVAATCTKDGNKEYWECNDCHAIFSDESLTTELTSTVVSATGHNYDENDKCTKCQQEIPYIKLGDNTITIEKSIDEREKISGYTLYKYTATEDGTLEVTAVSEEDTYGSLWASRSADSYLANDDDNGSGSNFKITYEVTKGTTYYIGARQYSGNAIEGSVTLNVKLNGIDCELPEGMTGKGTEAEPFVLKTAEHLGWFRDYVNVGNPNACAKIADDVEEIDMSSVCHPANDAENVEELSWTPIGNANVQYQGTFDGNGKTIKNLYINSTSENTGLFGYAGGGCLKDITFDNANVTSTAYYTGILVGDTRCTIQGIKTTETCSVKGGNACSGGIAGNANSNIINCENRATVNGTETVGGIAGYYSTNSITSCANYGAVTGTEDTVGGMVGYFSSGTIQNSANYGNIHGGYNIGNLIGFASKCNLNNVLGTGNVSETDNESSRIGMLVGYISKTPSTAEGILAYNSSATVTIVGTVQTGDAVKAIGKGSLTFADGKAEADVIKTFTAEQLASGEVAYLLNGSTSEGTLAWYQKIGVDANPVLTATEGNTVYKGNFAYCDGTNASFSNEASVSGVIHKTITGVTEYDANQQIYHKGCRNEKCPLHKYTADAAGTIVAELEGTEFVVTDMNVDDATVYESQAKFTATACNYTRTFSNDKWQAMYVPFNLNSEALGNDYELAVINNFHEYEQEDGTYKVVLEVKRVINGTTIPALTPCLIRQKNETSETQPAKFCLENVEFSPAAQKSVNCSSVTRYYEFTGTLEGKTGFDESKDYVLSRGQLYATSSQTTLKPQRWYLSATDRNSASGELQSARQSSIFIRVIGSSDATGVDEIFVNTDSLADRRQGIYDLQGRKLNEVPANGIYIMNGKKYVK